MARTEVRGEQILNGSVSLTVDVTGTLPVANGGSGAATLAANSVLLGNGTSALQTVAATANGNVLRANGTTWVSDPDTYEVTSTASSATPGVTVTGNDMLYVSALAVAMTSITVTGSPADGWRLLVLIKDNGSARTLAFGSSFQNSDAVTADTTTVVGKYHLHGYIYFSAVSKYVLTAKLTF